MFSESPGLTPLLIVSIPVGLPAFIFAMYCAKRLVARGWGMIAGYVLVLCAFALGYAAMTLIWFLLSIPILGLQPAHGMFALNAYNVPIVFYVFAPYIHLAAAFFLLLYYSDIVSKKKAA